MKENEPLDKFFEEISKLVEIAQKKDLKPTQDFPKDIEDRLRVIERELEIFNAITNKQISDAGITPEMIRETISETGNLPQRQRHLLARIAKLKLSAEHIQRSYMIASTIAKKQISEKKSKQISSRKKKFRGMGGQKDWKPL